MAVHSYIYIGLAWIYLCAGWAHAQTSRVAGPSLGLIHDTGSHSLRSILGVPGSAYLGPPLVEDISVATVAPDGKLALVWKGKQAWFFRPDLESGLTQLPEVELGEPSLAAWAADSSAVVLYAGAARRVQTIRNAPTGLEIDPPFDLPVEGLVTILSVTSRAGLVMAGIGQDGGSGFYRIERGGAQLLARMEKPGAAAFTGDGRRFIAADAAAKRIIEFDTGTFEILSSTPEDTVGASALAVSTDSRDVYVISPDSKTLSVYDLGSWRRIAEVPLEFEPGAISPLAGKNVYALAAGKQPGDPVWILSGRPPAIYFVPGGLAAAAVSGEPQ